MRRRLAGLIAAALLGAGCSGTAVRTGAGAGPGPAGRPLPPSIVSAAAPSLRPRFNRRDPTTTDVEYDCTTDCADWPSGRRCVQRCKKTVRDGSQGARSFREWTPMGWLLAGTLLAALIIYFSVP